MLCFATEIPVSDDESSAYFQQTVINWLLGSPHSTLVKLDLEKIFQTGSWSLRKGNEFVESLSVRSDHADSSAVRYTKNDGELVWQTVIAHSKSSGETWVSVRVSCESTHPTVRLPIAKKPIIVRTLLRELGGANDGELEVLASCHRLSNTEIDLAARMILGKSGARLPIVYVSARFDGDYIIDANRLASDLAGMAHVVVEPNRQFSLRLKLEADSKNVYGGNVGVYWPNGVGKRMFSLRSQEESSWELAKAIFEEVRTALINRRPLESCTWASIQERHSKNAFEELKASGSNEIEKYIDAFDDELQSKVTRLEDAEREISRLHSELSRLEAHGSRGGDIVISSGPEQNLYPNEIPLVVLDALREYGDRVSEESRRKHIVTAILNANDAIPKDADYRSRLKELLRGFRSMDPRTRRSLEDLGFEISEDGKHFKLIFRGDQRYTFTLPKSGSDHRGGLNAAGDIARLLF